MPIAGDVAATISVRDGGGMLVGEVVIVRGWSGGGGVGVEGWNGLYG